MPRDLWRAMASFSLNWFAFARPVRGGYMEARNDR